MVHAANKQIRIWRGLAQQRRGTGIRASMDAWIWMDSWMDGWQGHSREKLLRSHLFSGRNWETATAAFVQDFQI